MSSTPAPAATPPMPIPWSTPTSAKKATAGSTHDGESDDDNDDNESYAPRSPTPWPAPDNMEDCKERARSPFPDDVNDNAGDSDKENTPPSPTIQVNALPVAPRDATQRLIQAALEQDFGATYDIALGLIETLKRQGDVFRDEEIRLNSRIIGLEQRVEHWENTFGQPPEGYVENVHYPYLAVPKGNGLSRPVKWVKTIDDGTVLGYASDMGPSDQPYAFKVYAQPVRSEQPAEPLPPWLVEILMGPAAYFNHLQAAARKLDDWGVYANFNRWRHANQQIDLLRAHLSEMDQEIRRRTQAQRIIEGRLEAARVGESLDHLQGLTPGFEDDCRPRFPPRIRGVPTKNVAARGRAV